MADGSADRSDEALLGLNRLATVARLLSGAAHEVNNALQIISGTAEMLESRADAPPASRDALVRLKSQSARAATALGHVLLFARAPRGGGGPVNLREVVDESLALREFSIRRAGLTMRVDADSSSTYIVTGNRADLQQALLNLVMNAEHALRGTGGTILVQLSIESANVVLRVIDEGPGVAVDPPERAFQAFVTMHDPFESPGLGLWASRTIVEQHGGTVALEKRPTGAAFAVRLPSRPIADPRRTP